MMSASANAFGGRRKAINERAKGRIKAEEEMGNGLGACFPAGRGQCRAGRVAASCQREYGATWCPL